MTNDLLRIIYLSKETYAIDRDELVDMCDIFAARNQRVGITGVLLRIGNYFVQVLEGEADAVDRLFEKIRQDPRHEGLTALARQPIESRLFGEWSMTCADLDSKYYVNLPETANLRRQIERHLKEAGNKPQAMLGELTAIKAHIRRAKPLAHVGGQ